MKINVTGVIDTDDESVSIDFCRNDLLKLKELGLVHEEDSGWFLTRGLSTYLYEQVELNNKVSVGVVDDSDVKSWIEEYRSCFPKGLNSNGYSYRGDKNACIVKMQKFYNKYGFSKEEILAATKYIVKKFSGSNHQFLPQAHYIIEKNHNSLLLQYCELLKDNPNQKEEDDKSSYEEKL